MSHAKRIELTTGRLPADQLVPDTQLLAEFGVSAMTLHRWSNNPALNFPKATKINTRNYRSRREIESWKMEMARKSAAERVRRAGGGSA